MALALELLQIHAMILKVHRLRRSIGILGLILFLLIPLSAKAVITTEAGRKNPDNRELLAKAVEGLVSAWNANDAETIAGLFLPSAILVMPTGSIARSRSGIRERLLDEWRGKLKDTTLIHAVEDVAVLGSPSSKGSTG
ncbi:MAG: SgcJ/EcaC family oxidoreductase [Candidatus Binatia bacterium]